MVSNTFSSSAILYTGSNSYLFCTDVSTEITSQEEMANSMNTELHPRSLFIWMNQSYPITWTQGTNTSSSLLCSPKNINSWVWHHIGELIYMHPKICNKRHNESIFIREEWLEIRKTGALCCRRLETSHILTATLSLAFIAAFPFSTLWLWCGLWSSVQILLVLRTSLMLSSLSSPVELGFSLSWHLPYPVDLLTCYLQDSELFLGRVPWPCHSSGYYKISEGLFLDH